MNAKLTMSASRSFYSLHTRVRSHSRSLRAMANPSAVWAHFDLCSNDPLRAQCRICKAVVVRGGANPRQCGTTNLHRHLRVHHGGRLIGKRYHVTNDFTKSELEQEPQSTKTLKSESKCYSREMQSMISEFNSYSQQSYSKQQQQQQQKKLHKIQSKQKSVKTIMVEAVPLKSPQVTSASVRVPFIKQNINQTSTQTASAQPPTEVCLRWNSYHSNMQHSFPSFLDSEEFVDVTLACEGRSLKCHKMILSSCSDYLAQLLRENPCQHPIILMKDLKFWEIDALVKFMYRGEVNVTHDKLPQLLNAAETLQIKGLAEPSNSQSSKLPLLIPHTKKLHHRTGTEVNREKLVFSKEIVSNVDNKCYPYQLSNIRELSKLRIQHKSVSENEFAVKLEPLDIPLSSKNFLDHSVCGFEDKIHQDAAGTFENFLAVPDKANCEEIDVELVPELDLDEKPNSRNRYPNMSIKKFISSDFLEQELNNCQETRSYEKFDSIQYVGKICKRVKEEKLKKIQKNNEEKKVSKQICENLDAIKSQKRLIKFKPDRTKKDKTSVKIA